MNTDILNEARRDMADVMEEVGVTCFYLAEAIRFGETSRPKEAVASAEHAQAAIDKAFNELSKIRSKADEWILEMESKEVLP